MTRPIETLTVARFRALADLAMEGAETVNLLVGNNNSGKTSVLEAIALYAEALDPYAWRIFARRRVPGFRTISVVEGVKWLFPHGRPSPADAEDLFSGEIAIHGSGRAGARVVRASVQEIEEILEPSERAALRERGVHSSQAEDALVRGLNVTCELTRGEDLRRQQWRFQAYGGPMTLDRKLARDTEIRCELISPFDHGVEERYTGHFRRAVVGDYKSQVIEALQRIDPGIQDMEFLPLSEQGPRSVGALTLRHARSGRTPLSAFGDGVRRVLLMALALISARGGVLLVDEIETAIHISVLGDVFRWIVDSCRRYDVQMFATTHSLEALDAILAASRADLGGIAGYRLSSPEHAAPPKRYEGEQLSRLRLDRGLDVR